MYNEQQPIAVYSGTFIQGFVAWLVEAATISMYVGHTNCFDKFLPGKVFLVE
jgi:hypothetical protein